MPVAGLWFFYPKFTKNTKLPFMLKLAIGVIFFSFGLVVTYAAMLLQISALSSQGISNMGGVKMLIPVGIFTNLAGIAYLIFFKKD
jgi:hypothetical protein